MPAPRYGGFSRAHLQIALGAMLWGTWSLFVRPFGVDPLWSTALAFAAAGVVASPILLRQKSRGPTDERPRQLSEWWFVVLLGLLSAGSALLYFVAVIMTTMSIASLSHCTAPVILAIVAPWILHTERRRGAVMLAFVASAGIVLAMAPWGGMAEASGSPVLGALIAFAGAVLASASILVHKKIETRFTPEERLVFPSILAAPPLFILAALFGGKSPGLTAVALVLLGGALVAGLGNLLQLRGLKGVRAEEAGILSLLMPLTAMAVGWLVWKETPGISAAVGATLAMGATVFAIGLPGKQEGAAPDAREHVNKTPADDITQ